jgi:hypothetical protein
VISFYRKYVRIIVAVLLLAGLQGCKEHSTPQINVRQTIPTRWVSGFLVPVFPSPEEQLNYTSSWFETQTEKKAALTAVSQFFPNALKQRAEAALELSYLGLGRDYRLATPEACLEALRNYREIITRFHTLPKICAKAYWYMGWISCDLLKDNKKGVEMHETVVARYPNTRLNLTPPVPWVTFITPQASTAKKVYEETNPLWADLSRLEIIRHADNADTVRKAFSGLWGGSGNQRIVGIALKLLLTRQDLGREMVPFAEEYLQKSTADAALQNDIRLALAGMRQPNKGIR